MHQLLLSLVANSLLLYRPLGHWRAGLMLEPLILAEPHHNGRDNRAPSLFALAALATGQIRQHRFDHRFGLSCGGLSALHILRHDVLQIIDRVQYASSSSATCASMSRGTAKIYKEHRFCADVF